MPISGIAPLTVNFLGTSSPEVTTFLWTFGDGTTSTSQNPTKVYNTDGTYYVTLTGTGPAGSVTFTDYVIVGADTTDWIPPDPMYISFQGADPQVMLRISNDGGKTYITEQWRSAGKTGEFSKRVRWNRLGVGRRRVFEVSVTDPIAWKLTGAYLEVTRDGTSK